jgi:uncharacterized protein YqiB (DUF1249 family)
MIKMTPERKKLGIIRDMVVKENKALKDALESCGWTLDVWSNQIYLVTTLSADPSIVILSYEDTIQLSMEQIASIVTQRVQLEIDGKTLEKL